MPPALTEGLRAHLTRVRDTGLTSHARLRALNHFAQEIQRSQINFNPHLGRAMNTSLTLHAREKGLHRLLQDPLQIQSELEMETLRTLCHPIEGEESLAQLARDVIRKRTPTSGDDAFTQRIAPPQLAPPPARQDDLRDMQELQALMARQPEIKQRTERLAAAMELLSLFRKWNPAIPQTIEGLRQQYDAEVAVADRAAALHKKANAAAPADLTGKDYFELPQKYQTGVGLIGYEEQRETEAHERILVRIQGRYLEVIAKFNELKALMEEQALKIAGNLHDPDRALNLERNKNQMLALQSEIQSMLDSLVKQVNERKPLRVKFSIVGDDVISQKARELCRLLFEIAGQNATAGYEVFDILAANTVACGKLVDMVEKLRAFSDLTGINDLIVILLKLAEDIKEKPREVMERINTEQDRVIGGVKTAFAGPVELEPKVAAPPVIPPVAPPVAPPEPPKVVNYYFEALRHFRDLAKLRQTLSGEAKVIIDSPDEARIREMETIAPGKDDAILVADWALSRRNQVKSLSKETADILEKIQHCMEKYLAENFGLLVIEPTVGTLHARIHNLADQVGQEMGKFGEVVRVEALGFTDKDNKVVKKAKVILGDGAIASAEQMGLVPKGPESWSRVPPPALTAADPSAPVPPPLTVPPTPPLPAVPHRSLSERIRGIGQRIWRRWRRADIRLQKLIVNGVIWVAKKVDHGVYRVFGPADKFIFGGISRLIRDYITLPETIRIDAYYANNQWVRGEVRHIRRFRRKSTLLSRFKTPDGEVVAELHKIKSAYQLKTVGGHKVEIDGHEMSGTIPIKSGTVVKSGEWKYLIDIYSSRRSFRRGRGMVQIAGGENGEVAVENGFLLTDRAGRLQNEDAVGYIKLSRDRDLYIVADGVGGHNAGEVASRMLLEIVAREMKRGASLELALSKASQLIEELSQKDTRFRRMGSTLVATLIDRKAKKKWTAWVGDSRATYVENDTSWQLTRDHKGIWEAEETGIKALAQRLPIEESRQEQIETLENDPRWNKIGNLITHRVGNLKKFQGNIVEMPLALGPAQGILLLASDGLTDRLSGKRIAELIRQGGTLREIARRLVKAALEAGTRDNVSVILVRVPAIDLDPDHLKEQVFGNGKK